MSAPLIIFIIILAIGIILAGYQALENTRKEIENNNDVTYKNLKQTAKNIRDCVAEEIEAERIEAKWE